ATFQDVAHPELASCLPYVDGAVLVREARIARHYEQPTQARKGGDNLFDDAVREVLLLRIAAQILERQYRDRWLARNRERLRRRHCGSTGPQLGDGRSDEPITSAGKRLDPAFAAGLFAQDPAQRGDLDSQIALFDGYAGPRGLDQRILRDWYSRPLDQQPQKNCSPSPKRQGLGRAGKYIQSGVKLKRAKSVNLRHPAIWPQFGNIFELFWSNFATSVRLRDRLPASVINPTRNKVNAMSAISDCVDYVAPTLVFLLPVLLLVSILWHGEVSSLIASRRGALKLYLTVIANPAWREHSTARCAAATAGLVYSIFAVVAAPPAYAQSPIKIGFSMALTGGLSPNGRPALIAMKIWEEDVNARGGLLGRPVQLVYYDDQSNPTNVPGIYTKLLDVDKVDLVVGPYATNLVAPAMPVIMQRNLVFTGLYGFDVNSEFRYARYFSFMPTGQDSRRALSQGFFEIAKSAQPKPETVAIVAADAEFSRNAADGARANAQAAGLKIVYDKTYPPSTVDFTTILRAIQATNPDIVYVASYPIDTVGMVRAAKELGLKARQFGGSMVGLQTTSIKTQLGPLLNGIVTFDFWLPAPSM